MDQIDWSLEPVRGFLLRAGEFLPRILLAVVIVVVGWMVAKMVRFAIAKGLRAVNFNVLTERAGIDAFLHDGGIRADTTEILALLFYWLVVLASLVILAVMGLYTGSRESYVTQDEVGRLQENMRIGNSIVERTIRQGNYKRFPALPAGNYLGSVKADTDLVKQSWSDLSPSYLGGRVGDR